METSIEILIDYSRSMGRWEEEKGNTKYILPDGNSRMWLAKKTLVEQVIPALDYAQSIAVRTFFGDATEKLVHYRLYEGILNKAAIIAKINSLSDPENTGSTPITAALEYSIEHLARKENTDRKIILVTDGEETGPGNYQLMAEESLQKHGIPCNVFIVGIDQTDTGKQKAAALATATGGAYVHLDRKAYDSAMLKNLLRPISDKIIQTSLGNINVQKPVAATTTAVASTAASAAGSAAVVTPVVLQTNPITQPAPNTTSEQQVAATQPTDTAAKNASIDNVPVGDRSDTTGKQIQNDPVYIELVAKNTTALELVTRQLAGLTEAVKDFRDARPADDDDQDVEENPELNERIRLASETLLYTRLKEKYGDRVKWMNEKEESGTSYDFEVTDTFDTTPEVYIECKATMHAEKVFLMTRNEWIFFLTHSSRYQLFLITNALTKPEIIKIDNLMEWILQQKVLPLSTKKIKLKPDRIPFTVV